MREPHKYYIKHTAPIFRKKGNSFIKTKDFIKEGEVVKGVRINGKNGTKWLNVWGKGYISPKKVMRYVPKYSNIDGKKSDIKNDSSKFIFPFMGIITGLTLSYFIKKDIVGFSLFGLGGLGVGIILNKISVSQERGKHKIDEKNIQQITDVRAEKDKITDTISEKLKLKN